jgi:hypothetical protein
MGENVPDTSYLSQKEHSFIEKCNFCDDLKLLGKNVCNDLKLLGKNFWACKCKGLKNTPLKKSWLEHWMVTS